jgi:transcriptional regulator with XRE-family HTH domain
MQHNQKQNSLAVYRRRMRYSQRSVARLLGHKSHAAVSSYEHGRVLPKLEIALRLEIILRTPLAFLFPDLHDSLKKEIRDHESSMAGFGQQALFPEN